MALSMLLATKPKFNSAPSTTKTAGIQSKPPIGSGAREAALAPASAVVPSMGSGGWGSLTGKESMSLGQLSKHRVDGLR